MGYLALGALVVLLLAAWDNGQAQTRNGARRSKNHAGVGISGGVLILIIIIFASGVLS